MGKVVFIFVVAFMIIFLVSVGLGGCDDISRHAQPYIGPSIDDVCEETGGKLTVNEDGDVQCVK